VNRVELRQLAEDRARDAKALLLARRWSGAYYLAGYGVECALKVCVIRYLMTTDRFPERRFSERCWTHDLAQLMELVGIKAEFDIALAGDPTLDSNWGVVKDWSETARYERKTRTRAEKLYHAVTDKKHGVLPWIKRRW
jgi:hypothetical protein